MGRYTRVRCILVASALAAAVLGLLAGCAGVTLGRPTPAPGAGPLGIPEPTATQIAAGANPSPSAPRYYPFVAQVRPPGARRGGNPYSWLENVHSRRTRRWIFLENRTAAKALAAIPQRAWIRRRLERLPGGRLVLPKDDVVERAFYVAADGTRLPMQIAYRRGLARDGNRPTLLTVYHATGRPPEPLLQPLVLVWLDMGGIYVRAEVRNGLAKVPAPRGVARMPDRPIALSDLFAAAQSLIDRRYTRQARLGIYGRGFGGLMAGAAVALRPALFGAALPSGTWAQYRQIASGNCFPPTLVTTAERGGDVRPWQGYELAAVLHAEQICAHPILIQIESDGGPEAPISARRERTASELAFAAKWLGARAPGPAS